MSLKALSLAVKGEKLNPSTDFAWCFSPPHQCFEASYVIGKSRQQHGEAQ